MALKILRCDPTSLAAGVECADQEEVDAFFKEHRFVILTPHNFINFEKVETGHDATQPATQVDQILKVQHYEKIDPKRSKFERFNMIEHRVTLNDEIV